MKAITRDKYGGPNVLQIEELPKPGFSENEVLIKVHCTTVNRTDCGILRGKPYLIRLFTGLTKPTSRIPGTDFAGEIVAIGKKVKQFKSGDKVWGLNEAGLASQAEYMVMNENKGITQIPGGVEYAEAVACAEGGHYAYNFVNKVGLKKGDRILVNGATGAIGSAALQILKSLECEVTAVGNTKNLELLKSLGADKIYDYEKEDFTEIDSTKYKFVFDAAGKSSFGKCKKLLENNGVYISSELGPNAENLYLPILTRISGGKRVIFPIPKNCKRSILYLKDMFEKGLYKAVIDKRYQPEQIKEAYEYVEQGQKTGCVIIEFEKNNTSQTV
jgi:NADPH:quinone reductase-like Zn-dependent oxidoreductase